MSSESTPAPANPVLVDVWRGETIESHHRGAVAVADANGQLRFSIGDIDRTIYPRSAIKPLQALALLECGAAERFKLNDAQIALACASHGGEPMHTTSVEHWLAAIGLDVSHLRCGAHSPLYEPAAHELTRAGVQAGAQHNNCSGKHCGFLTLARHTGAAVENYLDYDHPTQTAWRNVVSELADDDLDNRPRAIDGCGIPVIGMPLRNIATAMARFARPGSVSGNRTRAIEQVHNALAAHPEMIAGTGRFCSLVIEGSRGAALIKTGAEGVYTAALPGIGVGIALKIDDGAKRASEYAMSELLLRHGELTNDAMGILQQWQSRPLLNVAGRNVGHYRAATALLQNG